MALLQIHQFPCLSDNYGFLIHERLSGLTATIDTPDAKVIHRELKRKGWRLTHILNTHHHPSVGCVLRMLNDRWLRAWGE